MILTAGPSITQKEIDYVNDAVKRGWNNNWNSYLSKLEDAFKEKFNAATAAVQGSGWGWLGYNKETGCLEIATCCNQDPLSTKGLVPLLGVDVWEHAYYLQYASARADYLKNIWNVVNWENVEQRFLEASKQ